MEQHNGWTNRETWAAFTWITSNEETYSYFRRLANDCFEAKIPTVAENLKGYFENKWERLIHGRLSFGHINAENEHFDAANMLSDIGSLWRVNWTEISKAIVESES